MRKLASIQKVWKIEPIEGADKIELAHVLGWQCVAGKGQFREGEDAVYFEIDSFLPVREEFEFLRKNSFKTNPILGDGFRLRTQRFRGQISQGLLMPLSAFPGIPDGAETGTDVTELLGVQKWEEEERATSDGTAVGGLPYSIPKTDEMRVQAYPGLLDEFAGLDYYITTKMDGTSCSVSIDTTGFHVTGRSLEWKDDDKSSFYKLVKKMGLREKMERRVKELGLESLTIQGELCAPGIQKNRLKLREPHWYVFTVREDGRRVDMHRMISTCHTLDLEYVPVEEIGTDLVTAYPTVEALLERADGEYECGGKKEGIVIRPVYPVYSPTIGGSLSMKVVNNNYLLKNE